MDNKSIMSDIPQIILDDLNRIDFKAIGMIKKAAMMTLLKAKLSSYPQKTGGAKSASGEMKYISEDFDGGLLNALDRIDWSKISLQLINETLLELKKHLGSTIPAKKA